MKVKHLKKMLEDLPDESVILVLPGGMSGPEEATRIIKVPKITTIGLYSFEYFENALWLCGGGKQVSSQAEEEGWEVICYEPEKSKPTKTETP